ncbi:GTP cyclohydrolase/3,4-dihydroxy-2-butanone 4-phosphate synthase bi-functional protein [Arthrobacter sp. Hiyo4]|nr:GTP cyclohydrolase/3,4-dihydroxy-2-butanone 4-phosphate synthase bi-functional protein [Arthrobacter sp. Hiyo4]
MFSGESPQPVEPHHFTVVVHNLGDHAHWLQSGEPAEVHGRLGMAGAFTHSSLNCPERENMPGPGHGGRSGAGVGKDAAVRARSVAEMPVLTPKAASQETVYAVPFASWFTATMGGSARASARSPLRGRK